MLSHSDQCNARRTFKQAYKHKVHKSRLIQIFAGSCAVAALVLLPFKDVETFPTVFPQKNARVYTTKHTHPLSRQLAPEEIIGEQIAPFEPRTDLYDLEGNLLGSFSGEFQETTPDDQSVITYIYSEGRSYISPLDGTVPQGLEGIFQGFTPSNQHMITYSQNQSHLYDYDGNLVMSLDGLLKWGTLDGQYLVTETEHGQAFNLYSADGELQAAYQGIFREFSLHTPHLITTDQEQSYLYNFDGTLAFTFEGNFQGFRPDGEGLVTLIYQPSQQPSQRPNRQSERPTALTSQSRLYNFDSTLQATIPGEFTAFTPDGQSLLTYYDKALHLYSLDSLSNGTDSNSERQAQFEGALLGITANAQNLVTASILQNRLNPQSWLYSIDGTKLANLEGLFIGFLSNEQRMVTSSTGIEGILGLAPSTYYIYDLAGNLKATITGQLLGLTQSGRQGLVVYAEGKTRLYDSWNGTEQAVFEGRVLGLTRDETSVFLPAAAARQKELTND